MKHTYTLSELSKITIKKTIKDMFGQTVKQGQTIMCLIKRDSNISFLRHFRLLGQYKDEILVTTLFSDSHAFTIVRDRPYYGLLNKKGKYLPMIKKLKKEITNDSLYI